MKAIALVMFSLFSTELVAQQPEVDFPIPLRPGQSFTIPAGYDTLFWLLKNAQFEAASRQSKGASIDNELLDLLQTRNDLLDRKVLKQNEKIELLESKISALQNKIEKLETKSSKLTEIVHEKDDIANLNYEGYIHYRDLWKETDIRLEKEEIKSLRRTRLAILGFLTAGLATTLAVVAN